MCEPRSYVGLITKNENFDFVFFPHENYKLFVGFCVAVVAVACTKVIVWSCVFFLSFDSGISTFAEHAFFFLQTDCFHCPLYLLAHLPLLFDTDTNTDSNIHMSYNYFDLHWSSTNELKSINEIFLHAIYHVFFLSKISILHVKLLKNGSVPRMMCKLKTHFVKTDGECFFFLLEFISLFHTFHHVIVNFCQFKRFLKKMKTLRKFAKCSHRFCFCRSVYLMSFSWEDIFEFRKATFLAFLPASQMVMHRRKKDTVRNSVLSYFFVNSSKNYNATFMTSLLQESQREHGSKVRMGFSSLRNITESDWLRTGNRVTLLSHYHQQLLRRAFVKIAVALFPWKRIWKLKK